MAVKKKPVWLTVGAHDKLKAFCLKVGRTQKEVLSELVVVALTRQGEQRDVRPEPDPSRAMGGVWIV